MYTMGDWQTIMSFAKLLLVFGIASPESVPLMPERGCPAGQTSHSGYVETGEGSAVELGPVVEKSPPP